MPTDDDDAGASRGRDRSGARPPCRRCRDGRREQRAAGGASSSFVPVVAPGLPGHAGRPRHRRAPPGRRRTPASRRSRTGIDARLVAALGQRGIRELYTHQASADRARAGRAATWSSRRRRRPARRSATTCPVLNADPGRRSVDARAVPVSDQGARAGPARRAATGCRSSSPRRPASTSACSPTTATRRRTRAGRSARRAHVVLTQPRHAARGHPAAPPAVGAALREPPLRRHRRAARVPRRVRQPPRQRAAAAAAHLPALRLGPAVHLLVGDDRQPARAGRAADRARRSSWSTRAARRAARSSSSSSTRRSSTGSSGSAGRTSRRRGASRSSSSGAACRSSSSRRAAWRPRSSRRYLKDAFDGPPGAPDAVRGYRGGYLPNRRREIEKGLRDGDGARRRLDQRARARHRHRRARRRGAGRLPGHDRRDLAARGPRGPPVDALGRGAGRVSSAPLDQFIVRNPSYFFDASPEHALINPDNLHILLDHVKCAAFELPFATTSAFGRRERAGDPAVLAGGGLRPPRGRGARREPWHWTSESYPADAVSLRSVSSDNFVVVDTTRRRRA